MSQSLDFLKLVTSTWHCKQMAFTVTKSQSNKGPLGCDLWMRNQQICSHLVESMPRSIKAFLLVQSSTNKVYLISRPVSINLRGLSTSIGTV